MHSSISSHLVNFASNGTLLRKTKWTMHESGLNIPFSWPIGWCGHFRAYLTTDRWDQRPFCQIFQISAWGRPHNNIFWNHSWAEREGVVVIMETIHQLYNSSGRFQSRWPFNPFTSAQFSWFWLHTISNKFASELLSPFDLGGEADHWPPTAM